MTNWLAAIASIDGVQDTIVSSGIANIIIKLYYPVPERVCLEPHRKGSCKTSFGAIISQNGTIVRLHIAINQF